MPISVACAPSMFQSIMTETLRGLNVLVYIDDILVIQQETKLTSYHLVKVEQALQQLQSAGFKAKFLCRKECEILMIPTNKHWSWSRVKEIRGNG